jgi:hypothetical protein
VIARPRLAGVLAQPDWRVALVTGGPATGKTVAVAQWFQTLDPVAREWVTLDAGDDRPERFWLTFVLALERAVPGGFARAGARARRSVSAGPRSGSAAISFPAWRVWPACRCQRAAAASTRHREADRGTCPMSMPASRRVANSSPK